MSLVPFPWSPDDAEDFGILGEHFFTITAWIDEDVNFNGSRRASVRIVDAEAKIVRPGRETLTLDVTKEIASSEYWNNQTIKAWRDHFERVEDEWQMGMRE